MAHHWQSSPPPEDALARLAEGNRRFREGKVEPAIRSWSKDMAERPQRPFAIVFGCSDSRTPVEILFDQGFGDLFVVRIAGNVVAPSIIGSIEFAAAQFGTRLVVVMGHTKCGAIDATVHALETGLDAESRNIRSITDRIGPHIEHMIAPLSSAKVGMHVGDHDALLREAMRANVRAAGDQLRHGSRILEDLVISGRIAVVSAEYEIETGTVHFFDEIEPTPPGAL